MNELNIEEQTGIVGIPESAIEEIAGGIRNALEKGEDLQKVKQSFINAGYPPQQVELAAKEFSSSQSIQPFQPAPLQSAPRKFPSLEQKSSIISKEQEDHKDADSSQSQQIINQFKNQNKKSYKLLYIIFGIVSVLILAGAAILGLYWDALFA